MVNLFDGPLDGLVARIMARGNAEAEAEAVDILAPAVDATILVSALALVSERRC